MSMEGPQQNPDNRQERLKEIRSSIEYCTKEIERLDEERENNADKLTPEEIEENRRELVFYENKIKDLNTEKSILEEELRFGKAKQEDKKGKKDKEKGPKEAKEIVEEFLSEYNLRDIVPDNFNYLNEAQQAFVVQNLKKRIVDIVKSDAETQYSEDLKKSLVENSPSAGKLSKLGASFKNIGKSIAASAGKELKLKELETEALKAIHETPEGKKLIADDFELLTRSAEKQKIYYDKIDKDFNILYLNHNDIEGCTEAERNSIIDFNVAANNFREMPYEWGQEGKNILNRNTKNRAKYEKAKKAYEKAKDEIIEIKGKRESELGKGRVLLEMSDMDSFIQMEQLMNTHPQFEQTLDRIAQAAEENTPEQAPQKKLGFFDRIKRNVQKDWKDRKEIWESSVKFVNTISGKNWTNRALMGAGFGFRTLAKGAAAVSGMTLITFASAPMIGASIGMIRGKIRGEAKLQEKQKQARHGQKDGSKNLARTTDVNRLTRRFNELDTEIRELFTNMDPNEDAETRDKREKRVSLFLASIEHAQGKIEKGEVNFGDAKSALSNQFKFADSLNRAMVLQAALSGRNNEEMDWRINRLIRSSAYKIERKVFKERDAFVMKQVKQGALVGAGFATFGYGLRALGEHWGWWGKADAPEYIKERTPAVENPVVIPTEPLPEADGTLPGEHLGEHAKEVVNENVGPVGKGAGEASAIKSEVLNKKANVHDHVKVIKEPKIKTPKVNTEDKADEDVIKKGKVAPEQKVIIRKPPENEEFGRFKNPNAMPKKPPVEDNNNVSPDEYGKFKNPNAMPKQPAVKDTNNVSSEEYGTFKNPRAMQNQPEIKDNNNVSSEEYGKFKNPNAIRTSQVITPKEETVETNTDELKTPEKIKGEDMTVDEDTKIEGTKTIDEHIEYPKAKIDESIKPETKVPDTENVPDNNDYVPSKKVTGIETETETDPSKVKVDAKVDDHIEPPKAKIDENIKAPEEKSVEPDTSEYEAPKETVAKPTTGVEDHIEPSKAKETIPVEDHFEAPKETTPKVETPHEDIVKKPEVKAEDAKDEYEAPTEEKTPVAEINTNPYGLSEELLKQTNETFDANTKHVFSGHMDMWEELKKKPAYEIRNITEKAWEAAYANETEKNYFTYLYKLKTATGLEPRPATLTSLAETNEQYIKRALAEAAKKGVLDQVKL